MAWSDAARQASALARRAMAKHKPAKHSGGPNTHRQGNVVYHRLEGRGINATWAKQGGNYRSDFYGSKTELKGYLRGKY